VCIDLDYYSSYSYALYYSWNRHGTVLLGHAVVDATEVWLDPTDNRAHNRVVTTADTHLRTDHSGLSFSPSAVTEAREALKHWKSIMAGGVYSLLIRKLSLGLLRARPRCFEP
jgi:hypothetical protein